MLSIEPRRNETLNVLCLAALPVLRMDEAFQLAELEFHHSPYPVLAGYLADLVDDLQAMIHVTLVVVCHVEDKQIGEIKLVHQAIPLVI